MSPTGERFGAVIRPLAAGDRRCAMSQRGYAVGILLAFADEHGRIRILADFGQAI